MRKLLILTVAATLVGLMGGTGAAAADKPNIVVVWGDDIG